MIGFSEVIQRAMTGPLVPEKEYDLKVFVPGLRKIIKKYDIRYDPETPVPSDDELADRLFQAGLEFYEQVGTYCVDTNRIIHFTLLKVCIAQISIHLSCFQSTVNRLPVCVNGLV